MPPDRSLIGLKNRGSGLICKTGAERLVIYVGCQRLGSNALSEAKDEVRCQTTPFGFQGRATPRRLLIHSLSQAGFRLAKNAAMPSRSSSLSQRSARPWAV